MIKLESGNVLLKPSQRKQLLTWLKRASRLAQRLGNFVLTISMHRTGRLIQMSADLQCAGIAKPAKEIKVRQNDWRNAAQQLVRSLTQHLHDLQFRRAVA
jgi:hypothetical protein